MKKLVTAIFFYVLIALPKPVFADEPAAESPSAPAIPTVEFNPVQEPENQKQIEDVSQKNSSDEETITPVNGEEQFIQHREGEGIRPWDLFSENVLSSKKEQVTEDLSLATAGSEEANGLQREQRFLNNLSSLYEWTLEVPDPDNEGMTGPRLAAARYEREVGRGTVTEYRFFSTGGDPLPIWITNSGAAGVSIDLGSGLQLTIIDGEIHPNSSGIGFRRYRGPPMHPG